MTVPRIVIWDILLNTQVFSYIRLPTRCVTYHFPWNSSTLLLAVLPSQLHEMFSFVWVVHFISLLGIWPCKPESLNVPEMLLWMINMTLYLYTDSTV
jgi:hypothetical protein